MNKFNRRFLVILLWIYAGSLSSFSALAQTADTDPPIVTAVNFEADTIFVYFNESVVLASGVQADFQVTDCKGKSLTPSTTLLSSNDEQIKLIFAKLNTLANEVTLAYTNNADRITDTTGNSLATFSNALNLSTQVYNVSNAQYTGAGEAFDPTSEESAPWAFQFNDTGSKLFVTGSASDFIQEYDLSVDYDVSTAVYAGASEAFFVGNQEGNPRAFAFSRDGLKMFVAGLFSDKIHAYTLTSPFDISTATSDNINIAASGETIISDITFSNDGLKLFVVGSIKDAAMEFIMTSSYDISTASYAGSSEDFSFQNIDSDVSALLFNNDGSKMYFTGVIDDAIYSYQLETPFDVSTAVHLGSQTLDVGNIDNQPRSLVFNGSGEKLFVLGSQTNEIHEYILEDTAAPSATAIERLSTDTLKITFDKTVLMSSTAMPNDFQIVDGDVTGFTVTNILQKSDELSSIYLVTADLSSALSFLDVSYSNNGNIYSRECVDLQSFPSPLRLSFELVPPEAVSYTKISNTEIKLSFDEGIQINFINLNDFLLVDCFGTSFALTGISSFVSGSQEVIFNIEDLAGQKGELDVSFTKTSTQITDQFGNELASFSSFNSSSTLDITSVVKTFAKDFSAFENSTRTFTFNPTGTKLYLLGTQNYLQTFSLSTPFDASTATLDTNGGFDYSSQNFLMTDIQFNNDGSKLFLLSLSSQTIYEYDLATNYDVSGAVYSGVSESLIVNSNGETSPTSMIFDDTGLKLYVLGAILDGFQLYNLSSPYDISTGVVASTTPILDVSGEEINPTTASFNADGSQLLMMGTSSKRLYNYALSTPHDVSSASLTNSITMNTPFKLVLDPNGNNFSILESSDAIRIYEINDITPPELSSLQLNSNISNGLYAIFNEKIIANSLIAKSDFTVTDALNNTFTVTDVVVAQIAQTSVTLVVQNLPSAVGVLNLAYINNGSIVDESCNEAISNTNGVELRLEGVAPVLLNVKKESNTDLTLFFSELIQTNGTNPSDFTVTDGTGNTYTVITQSDGITQDNAISLVVSDLSNATDTVKISYTNNNGEVYDFAGNFLATIDIQDGIPVDTEDPLLSSAIKVSDTLYSVKFSESIVPDESFFADFEVKDVLGNVYPISKLNDNNTFDNGISLEVASTKDAYGDITITYTNNNDAIMDLVGNTLKTDLIGVTIDSDQSDPELLTGRKENDTELTLFFSEPIQISNNNFSDFTITDDQSNSYAVTNMTDGTALDNQVTLTTASTANATGLIVTYANSNDAIVDFGGNSLQSVTGITLDTENPVLFSAYLLPSSNWVRVHFNEDIFGSPALSDFALSDCQGNTIAIAAIAKVNDRIWDLGADSSSLASAANILVTFDGNSTVTDIVGNTTGSSQTETGVFFDPKKVVYDNLALNVGQSNPSGMQFNDDGTKLFVSHLTLTTIKTYSLSTPYDIGTATLVSETLNSSNRLSALSFADEGNKLFATGFSGNIFSYDLASPYTLTGATYNNDAISGGGYSILVSDDGMHLVVNVGATSYNYYSFGTPYDLSTLSLERQIPVSNLAACAWSGNGDRFYTMIISSGDISEYSLQEPYSLKDALLIPSPESTSLGITGNRVGMLFNQTGDRLLTSSGTNIYQYSINADLAAPTLSSAEKNSDTAIKLTFNEAIFAKNTNPSDVVVKDAIGTSYLVTAIGDVVPSDAELELTVADFSGAIGDLQITYVGDNEEIADLSCNPLATDAVGVGIDLDQVSPTIVSAAKISQTEVEVTLSEPVQLTGNTTQSFEIRDALNTVLTINSVSDGIANDRKIILTISSLDQAVGDAMLSKTYDAANPQVQDFGGNDLQAEPLGVSIDLDQTAPTMESLVKISDTEVEVNFSEIVAINGTQFSDFVLTDNLGSTFVISNIAIISNGKLSLTTASLASVDNEITLTYTNSTGLISDLGNNELTTDNVGVSLDIIAPAKPEILSMADDLGFSTYDLLTSDTDLIISGTAEINSTVTIYLGGALVGTSMADTNGEFSYQTGVLADGDYILTATATDVTGNVGELSDSFSFTVKTSSPSVSTISRTTTNPFITTELTFSVSFTEGVSGVSLDDFDLAFTGTLTPSITALDSLSPTDYTVSVENLIEIQSGDLTLSLVDDNSIFGIAGNLLGGSSIGDGDFTGETYESRDAQTITFSPLADKTYSSTAIDLEASASSGLLVTYSVTGPAERNGTQLTTTGVGLVTVTANQSGDGLFVPALAESQSFNVGQARLVATADDKSITFGDALPSLSISYSGFIGSDAVGDLDTTPSASTTATSNSDAGTYPITVAGGSDGNYEYSYQAGELTVAKADQILTFEAVADIDLVSTSAVTLVASSSSGLAVDFAIIQGDGTISGNTLTANSSGTFILEASQSGTINYTAASTTQTFNVKDSRKTDQAITFNALVDKTYGDGTFALSATASSALPITFIVSGPATLDGSDLTIMGAGEVTVTAFQIGDETFNPATPVDQSFTSAQALLTVIADDQQIIFGAALPMLTLSYSGFIGSDAVADLDALPTATTTATASSDAGTYPITVAGGSDNNYEYSYQAGALTISKADQEITFDQITDIDIANITTIALVAQSSSGLAVDFVLTSGDGAIMDNTLTVNNTGNFTITASQSGDNNYTAASSVSQSFIVSDSRKTDQTITFDVIDDQTYGSIVSLSPLSTSNLAVSLTLIAGSATISGNEVTVTGLGEVIIEASQSGDDTYNPASSQRQSFMVTAVPLTLTADDQSKVYNTVNPMLTYSASGFVLGEDISIITEPTVSTTATETSDVGTYDITITDGSAANYDLIYQKGTLTVTKAAAQITITDLEREEDGTAKRPTITTNPINLNYTITYDGSTTAPIEAGSYAVLVSIDEPNYEGNQTVTLIITAAPLGLDQFESIHIYPNPVTEYIMIETNELVNLKFFGLNGQLIEEINQVNGKVDISNLQTGTYLMEVSKEKERTTVRIQKAN